ncbi:MAG TPA: sigma-70 family RNA polymerase sigma factor, partial [Candidatus Acidoferrum sp.]|nr:sigma-70 family RNA polymerase sigma factor [Candidatus Acidoferrum sp.]
PLDDAALAMTASERSGPDEDAERTMLLANMQTALHKLPADMRSVVELRFMQAKSVRQVAAQLGISEANVRVLQCRALRKLRDYLQ